MRRIPRRIALERIELGAGAAAAAIGALTLPVALLAPLFPVCATATCSPATVRYQSLLSAHPEGSVWALLLGLLALTLAGAAGAVTDARAHPEEATRGVGTKAGMPALWVASLAVFVICALGSRGPLGLLYLPSTLALALASYVALLRRLAARRTANRARPSSE